MNFSFDGAFAIPAVNTEVSTFENMFWWGREEQQIWFPVMLSGAARDAGNSPTTILRSGLLLGRITSTNKLVEWNPAATDGSQNIFGVLNIGVQTQRLGNNNDRFLGMVMVGGTVQADKLLIPGQSAVGVTGNANEFLIRSQMGMRFLFSDGLAAQPGPWQTVLAKTANFTITSASNNTLFTNRGASGAVTFTLPATPAVGLRFGFFIVADQTVTIAGGTADTMVVFNDPTADSIAFSTSAEKVGTMIEVIGDGTGWLTMVHLPAETVTPTIAT